MSILEKLKALFDAADQGKWTDLGRFHSIAFGVSESDEAIGNVFGIGPKVDANINLICQTQNMMPEILADLERLQKIEANRPNSIINLDKLKAAFEASTQDDWSSPSTTWSLLRNNIMCGNRFVAEVLVDFDNEVMASERLANAEFITLAHNMMPEIFAEVERFQWLEAELQRVRGRANVLESTLHLSIEVMQIMREQIDQFQSMFDDEDGPIESACPEHDDFLKKIAQVIE